VASEPSFQAAAEDRSLAGAHSGNVILDPPRYLVERGRFGVRRTYVYPSGHVFSEYRSYLRVFGVPFLHVTRGVCPSTGRRITARGVIAVGRRAVGGVAVGQLAVGVVGVGQLAVGIIAFVQAAFGATAAVGQCAVAALLAVGQLAVGYAAMGQLAMGRFVLGQVGVGKFAWTVRRRDPEAVRFFHELIRRFL